MFNLINKIFGFIFGIDFYCICDKKIKKAHDWISNYLNNIYKKEGIKINYTNHIQTIKDKEVVGKYFIKEKSILLKKQDPCFFMQELTALHEIAHHYFNKLGSNGRESEHNVEQMILIILKKDFPKWIIQTMKISIKVDFEMDYEQIWKFFDLSYFNIKLSERII